MTEKKPPSDRTGGMVVRVIESVSNTSKPKGPLGYPLAGAELVINVFRGVIGFPKRAKKK